ncbi:MAG: type II toxin-antitoxin system RelE/ParE family toxin [Duncaniella sp.]|nr:type II toxin-antitoxin system RelE/ParE family toxin [Duncaniella sp.]
MDVIVKIYDVPTKFIKHLQNTDLYEKRVSIGPNEYRTVLFAIDHSNIIEATRIILLNGFLKKSNKDYKKQIEIANKILKDLQS